MEKPQIIKLKAYLWILKAKTNKKHAYRKHQNLMIIGGSGGFFLT